MQVGASQNSIFKKQILFDLNEFELFNRDKKKLKDLEDELEKLQFEYVEPKKIKLPTI